MPLLCFGGTLPVVSILHVCTLDMYIEAWTYRHTHVHTYINISNHESMPRRSTFYDVCTYVCIWLGMHTNAKKCIRTSRKTSRHYILWIRIIYISTCIQAHTHVHMYTYTLTIEAYIHTYIPWPYKHTDTYIDTYIPWSCSHWSPQPQFYQRDRSWQICIHHARMSVEQKTFLSVAHKFSMLSIQFTQTLKKIKRNCCFTTRLMSTRRMAISHEDVCTKCSKHGIHTSMHKMYTFWPHDLICAWQVHDMAISKMCTCT
jgi:hypothetical protein